MCTITFFPARNGDWIVTDNRDEAISRPALPPKVYSETGAQLFYPKDIQSGGTWFGASNFNRAICLMNGAFKPHRRRSSYRKSRGIVVKELLTGNSFWDIVDSYELEGIEAFYALAFLWDDAPGIYELIWDENELITRAVDASQPRLWTSAMTYSQEQHGEKKELFHQFLWSRPQNEIGESGLWDFHHYKSGNKEHEGFIIDRGNLKTTSITQISIRKNLSVAYQFEDLMTGSYSNGIVDWRNVID